MSLTGTGIFALKASSLANNSMAPREWLTRLCVAEGYTKAETPSCDTLNIELVVIQGDLNFEHYSDLCSHMPLVNYLCRY